MKKSSILGSLVALSAGALLVAGCSNSNKSDSAKDSNKKVNITFWHAMNGPYQEQLDKIVKDFNSSQDKYVVKATAQGDYSALQKKVMAAGKSKSLPTMGQTTYTVVPDYQKQGLITSIDSFVNGKDGLSSEDKKDIYPAFLQSSKYDGQYYSMPFSKSDRIMYYNKDILEKNNLQVPKTFEDMQKMAATLKAKNIKTLGFDKSFDMEFEGLAKAAGNKLITDAGKVQINTKTAVEAANVYMDMVKDKTAESAGADFYYTQAFIDGKAAFYIGSSAGVTQMKKQAPKDFNWSTAPVPSYKGKSGTATAGNDLVMFKGASKDEQKGAWTFMKFITEAKSTKKWAMATGYVPLRKSVLEDSEYKAYLKENPTSQAAVDSLPDAFASTAFPGYSEYRNELLSTVDNMLSKNEDTQKALDNLQTKTETIMKENK